jgi:capsular polysaccharide transport system permease protein
VTELATQAQRGSFLRSLVIQVRVIRALLMREILTRHGRHNIGFMWIFVEPMMFTTGVVTLWTVFHRSGHPEMAVVPFCISGYGTVLMWRNTIGRSGDGLLANRPLMFHRNVTVLDALLANVLLESGGASISFVVLCSGFIFMGLAPLPHDVMKMILAWALLAWFSMAMGMIVGSLTVFSETFNRIWHVFSYLYLGMSGAFFMVDWLPHNSQQWFLLAPTVSCVELLRDGLMGPAVRTHYQLVYVACVNLVLLLIGLRLVGLAARRFEDGTL